MFILLQAVAQRIGNPALGSLGTKSGTEFLGGLIPALLTLAIVVGVIIFMFYLLTGAIQWISSGGDKGKLEVARQRLTQALVGLILLFPFFAIINLTECFFGIGLKQLSVGPLNISMTSQLSCGGSGSTSCTPPPIPCPPGQIVNCNTSTGSWYCSPP